MTRSASATASNNATTERRPASPIRVSASANKTAKTTSGRTFPLAAAEITLSGTIPLKKSPTPAIFAGATCSTAASADWRLAAEARGSGNVAVSSRIARAPNTADAVHRMTTHSTVRPAIPPARAASAPLEIPVTSSSTTSGMTVILSAFSHSVPATSANASASPRSVCGRRAAAMPMSNPATRAARAQ